MLASVPALLLLLSISADWDERSDVGSDAVQVLVRELPQYKPTHMA